jgi:hypothetical protein
VLVPLAVIGAVFAGWILIRRDRPGAGAAVILLGIAAAALGVALLATSP